MVRPIPVFAFAFAAFAAAWSKGSNEYRFEEVDGGNASELFLKVWRAAAPADGDFMVKVGVTDESGPTSRLCDRESADSSAYAELWLGQIAETPRSFCGVVSNASDRPRPMRRGERISFEPRHILGWTLSVNATRPATADLSYAAPLTPSAKLLADLEIS